MVEFFFISVNHGIFGMISSPTLSTFNEFLICTSVQNLRALVFGNSVCIVRIKKSRWKRQWLIVQKMCCRKLLPTISLKVEPFSIFAILCRFCFSGAGFSLLLTIPKFIVENGWYLKFYWSGWFYCISDNLNHDMYLSFPEYSIQKYMILMGPYACHNLPPLSKKIESIRFLQFRGYFENWGFQVRKAAAESCYQPNQ